jgi:hypothetical protein
VPTDAFELAAPFRPRALKRKKQSFRAVDPLFIVVDLYAQPSSREGMLWVASNINRPSIFDGH